MRIAIVTALLLLVLTPAAQAQEARSAVYGELLGNAFLFSVNYDYRFRPSAIGRVGLAFISAEDDDGDSAGAVYAIPVTATYLSNPMQNNHFEAGGGLLFFGGERIDLLDFDDEDDSFSGTIVTGVIGYRYQRPGGGFVFRAGLTPFVADGTVVPWFGVSFGGSF
jgi:hypothetical protein